ncbi:MAG: hypothetical protein ACK4YP_04645, partial [Myxococcota bacterium]
MRAGSPLLALAVPALVSGCVVAPDERADTGATVAWPRAEVRTASTSRVTTLHDDGGWLAVVQRRIEADARAIHAGDGAFRADLPSVPHRARLDAEGVTIEGPAAEAFRLRTAAWGRDGSLVPLAARPPALGACTADVDPMGGCVRRLEYATPGLTEWWVGLAS